MLVYTVTNVSFQSQSYFVGPIAKALPQNCDLGMWLAFGFTAVVYPAFRCVELRVVGR